MRTTPSKTHPITRFIAALGPGLLLWHAASAQELERVTITGSSIKRIDAETALPVQIIRRDEIERTGATSTEELVKQISALSSSGSSVSSAGAAGYGGGNIATVSLRGLGSARTLVLVNGRRASVYGGGSAGAAGSSVDINSIPLAAIERIEVLKDGASAIYGSDAIAGVVNFILRRDFTGVEATAAYGQPTHDSHGGEPRISLFGGVGNLAEQGYNLSAGLNLQRTGAIYGSDRDFSNRINVEQRNDFLSNIAFPANVFTYGTGALKNPLLPNCWPVSQVSPFRPTYCTFDNSPYASIQPKSEKINLLLSGRLALSAAAEGYVEGNFGRTKTTTTTQPVPLSSYGNALSANNPYNAEFRQLVASQYPALNLKPFSSTFGAATPGVFLLPTTSPYYPTAWAAANGFAGLPLGLNYRDVANGARNTLDTADNLRLVTGLRGSFAQWDYDTGVLYNESKVRESLLTGYAQYSKVLPIFNSGVINPFGDTADASALDALRAAEFTGTSFTTKTSTLNVDAKASREVFTLPAGNASVALGAELRQERFNYDPSVAIQQGDIAGLGGSSFAVDAKRHVASTFVELSVPLATKLDADVALRYDNYQKVGTTVNPKASLRWQPLGAVLLRASAGSGFRAPSLTDLYTAQATGITANGTRDPLRCPNPATGAPSDCNFQFATITGGNPALKPEKSESYTFGLVLEPIKELSLSLDAFRVALKNAIVPGGLNYTYFLADASRAQQYADFILRGPADGNASGVGPIIGIVQTNANLFNTKVSGVDVDLKYTQRLAGSDKLALRLNGTYLNRYDIQGPNGSYTNALDQAVSASGGGVILRWRHTASLAYETGPWGGSLAQNYQKAYTDILGRFAPAGSATRRVSAYETYDAQGTYSGFKSIKLTLGVKNLTDVAPPYTNNASNFLGGYDGSYADVRGRFVYGSVTYRFN
jgi:iron complex outermembrane recepter protein